MQHWIYLGVLLGCAAVTLPLEIAFDLRVLRRPVTLLVALLPELFIFGAWDVYAVRRDQWSYDRTRIVGVILPSGIPVEEVLFFVVIPICAVLTFEAVDRRRQVSSAASRDSLVSESVR